MSVFIQRIVRTILVLAQCCKELIATFSTIEEGCALERFWIKELDSKVPNGYNLNGGGDRQFAPCEEVRDKIATAHKGLCPSKESRRKMSEHCSMKRPEVRAKMLGNTNGKGCKGKPLSEEHKANLSKAKKGKPMSEKQKASRRHPWTPTRRTAQPESKNRPWSSSHRLAYEETTRRKATIQNSTW